MATAKKADETKNANDKTVDNEAYEKARKRVEEKLGFYIHAAVFVGVNAVLAAVDLTGSPEKLWFHWVLIGWGLGLALHGVRVFLMPQDTSLKDRMIEKELAKMAGSKK